MKNLLVCVAVFMLTFVPVNSQAQISKLNRIGRQVNRIVDQYSQPSGNRHIGNNHNDGHLHDGHNSHGQNRYSPGYHIDHHDHVVRDSHGHVIGRYHHDVVHRNSTYVVPHNSHSSHHGTYHVHNGVYYYTPQTVSAGLNVAPAPVQVQFGAFSHVDDLALRLEELTNEFCLDLHYNYSHNPGFRETYAESYQLLQVAKFIHDAEHANDREAIRGQLSGMDALFHHVQDDVRGWSRHHHQQIGQLGILSKMDMIESTLHHLMNDVGVHGTVGEEAPPPGSIGQEIAPPPVP